MWLAALLYFFLPYLLMGLLGGVGAIMSSAFLVSIGYMVYLACILFLFPIYGNALYYNHCKKPIAVVTASGVDVQRQLDELFGKGGTSNVVIIILLVFVVGALIGILAATAIPAYQDYTIKARTYQAYELGKSASVSVGDLYSHYQAVPGILVRLAFLCPCLNFYSGSV